MPIEDLPSLARACDAMTIAGVPGRRKPFVQRGEDSSFAERCRDPVPRKIRAQELADTSQDQTDVAKIEVGQKRAKSFGCRVVNVCNCRGINNEPPNPVGCSVDERPDLISETIRIREEEIGTEAINNESGRRLGARGGRTRFPAAGRIRRQHL